jgi:hypothetical protein
MEGSPPDRAGGLPFLFGLQELAYFGVHMAIAIILRGGAGSG